MTEVTQILSAIEQGDTRAAALLWPLVYDELRKLAARRLAQERPGQTLQATALVHEAYLRLVNTEQAQHWNSRQHFFAAAAEAMRRILVEQARRKKADKRGGGRKRVSLYDADVGYTPAEDQILDIDEALTRLAAEDAQAARLIQFRFFGGLSIEDAAALVGISRSSAYEHWAYARVRLRRQSVRWGYRAATADRAFAQGPSGSRQLSGTAGGQDVGRREHSDRVSRRDSRGRSGGNARHFWTSPRMVGA
ncbi:MAG: ECF-type sigma factor [Gemmataceae bacterium]